jgi:enterochelin esterase-like enzyme
MTGASTPVVRVTPPPDLTSESLEARRDSGEPFPIVDGEVCTFAFRGPAIAVRLVHFGVGLPDDLAFQPVGRSGCESADGDEWWMLGLRFPRGSRLEYKLEVTDSFGTRLIEDPLNQRTASHPFGGNSVCEADGYATPDWAITRDDVPRGSIHDVVLGSAALGRSTTTSVYLPAGYSPDPMHRAQLVVIHDGPDYVRFASATTVLDNLIHGGILPPTVVAFLHVAERLVEYADDARHHEFLTTELIPHLESELSVGGEPSKRCLAGASFGAVASLSAATHAPGTFGRLLLQSGSFAGAGVGCWPRPEALWRPIKRFVHAYLADPAFVADRIYVTCGVYESLICENRGIVPVLENTGMDVTFDESLDGHNWASWRDRLGVALPALLRPAG